MINKYALLFVIVVLVIFVDQWSKQLAVHYLRSPDDSDFRKEHFQKCTTGFNRCKAMCLKKSRHASGSMLACNRTCERTKNLCRRELEPSYKQAKTAWLDQLEALKASPLCRRVVERSPAHPECVVVENYWHFTYRTNSGAAWGIFSTVDERIRRPFFISITIIAILFIFYLFAFRLESEHLLMIVALALILGGALGNFFDRLRLNYVIDFIEWFWRSRHQYTWPTFNIADAAISIGVVLIGLELLFFAPPEEYYDDGSTADASTETEEPSKSTVSTEHVDTEEQVEVSAMKSSEDVALDPSENSTDSVDTAPTQTQVNTQESVQDASSKEQTELQTETLASDENT